MKNRPYQTESLQAITANHIANLRRNLLVLPTGTGKTVVMAQVPKAIGEKGKWMLLIHRKELATQGADKLSKWNPDLEVGVEMGQSYSSFSDDVIVASVQSLYAERLAQFNPEEFAGIMVDEAHHCTIDNSYSDIFKYFGVDKPESRIHLLGVTATDKRGDGKSLGDIFDTVAYKMTMWDAVEDGWIVPLRGYKVTTHVSLDNVKITAGDFNQRQLEKTVNTPVRNKQIVDTWLEKGEDRQTVGFTVDIQHAKDLAEAFRAQGVQAQAVWGVDPDRDYKIRDHKARKLRVLCNSNVLTEGYDDWQIGCIIGACPTKSSLRYVQQIGRGTRLPEGTDNLLEDLKAGKALAKTDMIVIDAVDNSSKHSLMTLSTLAGLNPQLDLHGRKVFEVKKQLNGIQAANPHFDPTGLLDSDKIERIVEEVDLWKVKYADEILKETANKWYKTLDGQYLLQVAKGEGARIWSDLLDKWSCHFRVGDNEFRQHDFRSRREAFQWADRMLNLVGGKLAYFARRGQVTGAKPATAAQLDYLRRLGVQHPPLISKEDASKLITDWNNRHFTLTPKPTPKPAPPAGA